MGAIQSQVADLPQIKVDIAELKGICGSSMAGITDLSRQVGGIEHGVTQLEAAQCLRWPRVGVPGMSSQARAILMPSSLRWKVRA